MSEDELHSNLDRLLVKEMAQNEAVFDWIGDHLTNEKCTEPHFIKALTSNIFRSSIRQYQSILSNCFRLP